MGPARDRHRTHGAQVDQPGLLNARDDLHRDAGLVVDPAQEPTLILGLPHRAGGHRHHVGVVGVGDVAELHQRGDGPLDGVGHQQLHVVAAGAEAHRHALPGQDLG